MYIQNVPDGYICKATKLLLMVHLETAKPFATVSIQ